MLRYLAASAALIIPLLVAAPSQASSTVTLSGVTVHLRAGTRQVVTVNRRHGSYANVAYWRRKDGHWHKLLATTKARIGYGGVVAATRRKQGTGTTPLGTFNLISTFGTHPRAAAWSMSHRRIRSGDYWVEDNASRYYNRYRNKAQGGFRWSLPASDPNSSERLQDYPRQYEYAVVVGFNWHQVRHRGAGIFLHVNGKGATAGCVSVPRWFMREMFDRLDPAWVPVIAIGR